MQLNVVLFSVICGALLVQNVAPAPSRGQPVDSKNNTGLENILKTTKEVYYLKNWYRREQVGTKEPCPKNMVFLVHETRRYQGACRCDPRAKIPLLYYSRECYEVFTQGPCGDGEWIVQENHIVKCVPNPCSNEYLEANGTLKHPLVDYKDNCVEYNSKCEDNNQVQAQLNENGTYATVCTAPVQNSIGLTFVIKCANGHQTSNGCIISAEDP